MVQQARVRIHLRRRNVSNAGMRPCSYKGSKLSVGLL